MPETEGIPTSCVYGRWVHEWPQLFSFWTYQPEWMTILHFPFREQENVHLHLILGPCSKQVRPLVHHIRTVVRVSVAISD